MSELPGTQVREDVSVVVRHKLADRLFHWLMAASMLTLLGTGFLPVLGVKFPWVDPHWIAGVVLILLLLFHVIRVAFVHKFSNMRVRWQEFREAFGVTTREVLGAARKKRRIGKYSVGQKMFHHAVAITVLTVSVTGVMMMVGIESPFWERNPLFISEAARGLVFVLHGFAGLFCITMIIVHIYFAFRPEKWYLTKSMLRGWIGRADFEQHHDANLWLTERK
jgi:cytochrome b subunit of formate dehydrogenase